MSNEKKPKGLEEGPKIWVESLMTKKEWHERYKTYPTSSKPEPPEFFKSDYEWRQGMGSIISADKIENVNKNLEYLLQLTQNEKEKTTKAI